MTQRLPRVRCALAVCALAATCAATMAGPLTPPAGPVQSTDRVRIIPQAITSLPYVISQPGSYVLTGDLVSTGFANGIEIDSNDVTLDLGGFVLDGAYNGDTAIKLLGNYSNVRIYNGQISHWNSIGIEAFGDANVAVGDVRVYECSGGIWLGNASIVTDCSVTYCYSGGINVGPGSSISNCVAQYCSNFGFFAGYNSTIRGCAATDNGGPGFQVAENCTIADCAAYSNSYGKGSAAGFDVGDGATITGCTSAFNSGDGYNFGSQGSIANSSALHNVNSGINAYSALTANNCICSNNGYIGILFNGGTVTGCTAVGNNWIGISNDFEFATIIDCNASQNGWTGISVNERSNISNCTANSNDNHGIELIGSAFGSQVTDCATSRNLTDGINVTSSAVAIRNCTSSENERHGIVGGDHGVISGCHASLNGSYAGGANGSGIRCELGLSRIDGNHVSGNDVGIEVNDPNYRNTIIRNSATDNTTNYLLNPSNDIGPIGTAATSTSPWANIAF